MINNFDPGALTAGAETFVNSKVVKGIMTTREQMCAFFTEENKKGIKDKIGGLIAGWAIRSEDGSEMKVPANPPLAKDNANFVNPQNLYRFTTQNCAA